MIPAAQRAHSVLEKVKDVHSPIVVEVGVFIGAMSQELLKGRNDLHLIMVDCWGGNESQEYKDTNDFHANATAQQQAGWEAQARAIAAAYPGRVQIIKEFSTEAAKLVDDLSVDLVFIDADHSYKGCKEDIRAWEPKVKHGGWLAGHDYENNTADFKFGVTEAVDEYLAETGKELSLGLNYTWFTKC